VLIVLDTVAGVEALYADARIELGEVELTTAPLLYIDGAEVDAVDGE